MNDRNLRREKMLFEDSQTQSGNREQHKKTWRTSLERNRGNNRGRSLTRSNSYAPQRLIQHKSWGDQGELRVRIQNHKKKRFRFKEYAPPSDEEQSAQIVQTFDGVIYYSTLYNKRLWKVSEPILAHRYYKYMDGKNSSSDYQEDKMYQSDQYKGKNKKWNKKGSNNQKNEDLQTDQGENDAKYDQISPSDKNRRDTRYFENYLTGNAFRNAVRCYKCGKNGHIARRCIEEKPAKKCYYCTKDHHYNLCESSAVCNKCGESDHIEYECDVQETVQCNKCSKYGHKRQECGILQFSRTKNFESRKKIPYFNLKQSLKSDVQKLICLNNCQTEKGHFRCYRRSDIKGNISNIYPKQGGNSYSPLETPPNMSSVDFTNDQHDIY